MLIVSARSKNDYHSYINYIKHTDKKKSRYASTAVTAGLIAACTVAVVAAFFIMGGNIFLYVVLATDIVCALAFLFVRFIAPRIEYKKLGENFTVLQTFNFYDSRLELIVSGEKDTLSRIPYARIVRIMDTPDAFYIYVAKDRALILNKSSLTKHETEKLRALFKEKSILVTE